MVNIVVVSAVYVVFSTVVAVSFTADVLLLIDIFYGSFPASFWLILVLSTNFYTIKNLDFKGIQTLIVWV